MSTYPSNAVGYSAQAQFFGAAVPSIGPTTVEVRQKEFAHDIAVLHFWGGDVDSDSFSSGMPMSLVFGRPTSRRTFFGYVNHATRTNNVLANNASLADRNATTVYCVGASWYMKQAGTAAWTAQTASQIVQSVADLFGLAADITPDTTIWPTIQMAGMSYWQLCVMLAKRIGYTFYCSGTQLVFKPRQTDPSNVRGLVATYNYQSDPASMPIFTPTVGATSPGGGQLANRQIAGVDPRTTAALFSAQSGSPTPTVLGSQAEEPVFSYIEHSTVNSQQEADAKVQGSGALNQLYITASATAAGDPLVSQGSLIYVCNANGSQNGLWFVEAAIQKMNTSTYTMDLALGRDSRGSSAIVAGVIQIASPTKATLYNNIWVSV